MQKLTLLGLLLIFVLTGCGMMSGRMGMRPMGGMGSGGAMSGMHETVQREYDGLTNPVSVDDESISRGAEIYNVYCSACHGESGMGDGQAASDLDPAPARIALTSQMASDDYLFWRISEGGAPFDSAMPMFKAVFDEQEIWDVINYVRALGSSDPAQS
jgi:mono/diheme cytochrome c family protein